jgi:hypothetical protein
MRGGIFPREVFPGGIARGLEEIGRELRGAFTRKTGSDFRIAEHCTNKICWCRFAASCERRNRTVLQARQPIRIGGEKERVYFDPDVVRWSVIRASESTGRSHAIRVRLIERSLDYAYHTYTCTLAHYMCTLHIYTAVYLLRDNAKIMKYTNLLCR